MASDIIMVKYTGDIAVSIISDNIGMVEPGGMFPVPADRVGSYTSRSDMTVVAPSKQKTTTDDASTSAA